MTQSAPPEVLQKILGAARSRQFDQAALIAAAVLGDHPDDTRLAALAGAVEMQRGQFVRAAQLLAPAQIAHPGDVTIRANLAEARYHSGDPAGALALCDDHAIADDASGRLLRLGAYFAQETEDYNRAVTLYRQIVSARPDDWSSWNNLGNALGSLGDFDGAIAALSKAASIRPTDPAIGINLANTHAARGDHDTAIAQLAQLAEANANDVDALLALFVIYTRQGREDDAYAMMAEAARRAPGTAQIRLDYAQEAAKHQDYAVAEREYEAALTLDPALGPAFVGLASLYERMNREAALDPLLERVRSAGGDPSALAYVEALVHKRGGDFDAAFAALEQSGGVVVPGRMFHLRGVMLDRLQRHDEAFAAFDAMNLYWQEDPTQPRVRAAMYRAAVAHDCALLDSGWASGWTPPPPPDCWPTPVFLVGFPRSGTTLLDTMLMREPRAIVLEEEPFITDLEMRVGGIAALPALDQQALSQGRDYYFERVGTQANPCPTSFVVDKHPLHLNKVAVIRRFFPGAKFILALRHPMDVVLSCYLTNFRINNAMANFLDLGDAAALYGLTFTHWQKACGVFDLPVKTVVYERLVEDTTRELRPLFDWLSLDWPGDELDHREAARARGVVHTASYAQVTEPIYQRARGRWHRYRRHLDPVVATLRPWVETFGYSLDDGRIPPWPDDADGAA